MLRICRLRVSLRIGTAVVRALHQSKELRRFRSKSRRCPLTSACCNSTRANISTSRQCSELLKLLEAQYPPLPRAGSEFDLPTESESGSQNLKPRPPGRPKCPPCPSAFWPRGKSHKLSRLVRGRSPVAVPNFIPRHFMRSLKDFG